MHQIYEAQLAQLDMFEKTSKPRKGNQYFEEIVKYPLVDLRNHLPEDYPP